MNRLQLIALLIFATQHVDAMEMLKALLSSTPEQKIIQPVLSKRNLPKKLNSEITFEENPAIEIFTTTKKTDFHFRNAISNELNKPTFIVPIKICTVPAHTQVAIYADGTLRYDIDQFGTIIKISPGDSFNKGVITNTNNDPFFKETESTK